MWLSTFSTAAKSINGPCVDPGSIPGAGVNRFTASASFPANAS